MSKSSQELSYEILKQRAQGLNHRYNQANASKSFFSSFLTELKVRHTQIALIQKTVEEIDFFMDRLFNPEIFTQAFCLSALRGAYFSVLVDIKKKYTYYPDNYKNSILVKILLENLELEDLPGADEIQNSIKQYQELLKFSEIKNSTEEPTAPTI